MLRNRGGSARLRSLGIALLAGLIASLTLASLARADGTPDISASVSSSSQLYGQPVHVTLAAANPGDQPYGYNLSYRVVLPKGVSYSGGSPVAPEVIVNQPLAEQTTLIFGNVADLSPGSDKQLGFDLAYDNTIWHAGEAFPVEAQAFINSDPRYVPKFTADGQPSGPDPKSFTGFSAEVSGDQRLNAIKVSAEEPSPEGEIRRGVHEDQTVYTLKVENNLVNPTTEAKLNAFLPDGLEYLGCGAPGGAGTDHTTNAIATNPGSPEEYDGSGPIKVEALAECAAAELVETEELDPDGGGPMPFGVYTHVRWDVGALTPGQVKTFKYRAAIPLRKNVLAFTGTKPSGASGEQAVNLDNNTGAETVDEESLPTLASASGTYQGGTPTATSDETILDRTAEDWAVHKTVEAERLEQGQNVKWNLSFETSEYKFVKDGVVTDTLPNGLCPLGPENFTSGNDPADTECDPVIGKEPSAPYTSAVENANGTWTLTWDATDFTELEHTAVNANFTLSFWSHTRTHYQENFLPTTPVLSRDRVSNGVTTEAEGFARCVTPEATNCENPAAKINHLVPDGTKIVDASSADLEAVSPTLEKWVAASGFDCQSATYVKTAPKYHPGDKVCWKLRISFPGTLDTDAQTIADFLPPETTYVAGSDEPYGDNNVNATLDASEAGEGVLNWTAENSTVPAGGQIFERVIATKVAPTGSVINGDLKGNLLKFASANTPGESEALRAEANYEITTPVLALTKGVAKINGEPAGGNGPNVDGGIASEGQTVEYRIDVKNEGEAPAKNVQVWDLLEDGISCADFKIAGDLGGCNSGADRVEWLYEPNIAPGETHTFTYVVEIPAGFEPGKRIDDHAGVVSYQSETNEQPLPGLFTYIPAENIGGAGAGTPNAPAADDTSFVETPGITFLKDRVTAVTEPGNNELTQATIGEEITYTSRFTLPEGTTLYAGAFKDILGNERFAELIDAEAKMNGGPLPSPSSVTADPAGIGMEVTLPPAYTNLAGSGDDQFEFIIKARVADSAANSRVAPKQVLTNTADMSWNDQAGESHGQAATVDTEIVEPSIGVTKTDNDPDKRVSPGQIVEYTVTTSNNSGIRVSTAHDTETLDQLPEGLILLGAGTEPLADNAEIPGSEGAIWNATTRTIKKGIATLAPGQSKAFTYRAEVEDPAVAGSVLTNSVSTRTTSLAEGTSPIRRTTGTGYAGSDEDTVRLVGASIVKSSTPDKATPGDPLTYTLKVTIPASVQLFDTTVRDVLPAGVEFDGYTGEKCLDGCTFVNPIQRYEPEVDGATGTETIAWDLGDIDPALTEPEEIEFTYVAHLRETNRGGGGEVLDADTEVNAATVGSNLSDNEEPFDKDKIPTSFDETSPQAKTTTTVVEPKLTLDKQIKVGLAGSFSNGPVTAHGNDLLSYRLVVSNSGSSAAYNAEITDVLDPALTNPTVSAQMGLNVITPWNATTHSMTLEIEGPIPAGGSATIEYTAGLIPQSGLHDAEQVVNTADLAKYFGVPKAEREANSSWEFRQYDGNEDSTEAVLDFPTFGIVKTTGLSGNPDGGNAELNQEFPWRIVASNSSATAGATDVVVTDTLPPKWSYVPGTAKFDGVAADNPEITESPSGDKLEWTLPSLAAAASRTITFGAKPALGASTTEANVNTAQVTGATDESGKTEVGGTSYRSTPDDAQATLLLPDLKLEKTPDEGAAIAGGPGTFTVKVTNSGPGTARNLDIEDGTSDGMTYTAGSATALPATGFSEASVADNPAGGQFIHWHLDSLASGTSVTITMPVAIDADLPDATTLTNVAKVTSEELPTPDSEAEDDGSLKVSTEADMTIAKTGDAGYTAGEQYTWHLQVKNLGPSDAQAVEVKDPLPAGVTFVSASTPCGPSGGEVKCVIGTAEVGFDHSYDVTVEVKPDTTTSPLSNTATVSTTTKEPTGGGEPNSDTFGPSPSPVAEVWIKKSAEPGLILKTQETEYTLEVGNDGPSTARAVKLVDPMPAGMEFISADAPCTEASGTVTCEFGDLDPGQTKTIQVRAKGITNGTWPNTATVETTTPEPETPEAAENNHATSEVIVGPVVDMTINKTGPATVTAGGQLTWTIDVSNDGPDDATGVRVEDTLPAGVQFVSADPGCIEAGGKVTCDLGDMAFGESAERHITVTVPTALADQTLVNTVMVEADQGELEKENNHSEAKTTVGPAADLAITKTGPAKVTADGDVTWTLTATNNGPSTATGVKVEDSLPGGVELRSAHPSQGSCSGSLECALGTLARGASARIEVTAHVPDSFGGQKLTNKAKVSGEELDPNPDNNSASATTEVDPKPTPKSPPPAALTSSGFNLTLEKRLVNPSQPQLGDVLTYSLTVTNQGPASARQVEIEDRLPGGLKYVSASIPGGKCSAKGAVVTCKLASLAAGAKKVERLKARAVGSGRIKNTAAVSAAGADRKPADNDDGAVADVSAGGTVLKLTKKRLGPGLVEAGKKVKFRIKVTNRGRVAADDVVVCDRLPNTMSFVKVRKAKFERGDACWTIARLGPHRSRGFTVVARIDGGVGDGKLRNVAAVEAENAPDRSAAAPVRVKSSGPGREGGVTG